jgi:hypothetical protein
MYVSEEYDNEVVAYPEPTPAGSPVETITDGVSAPWGLCVDQNESLYSVNQAGTVTEYPYGSISPTVTYSQDLGRPLYCVVGRNDDLFVGNGNGARMVERSSNTRPEAPTPIGSYKRQEMK